MPYILAAKTYQGDEQRKMKSKGRHVPLNMAAFGRGDGICAFGGAPRRTAHRAVRFAFLLTRFHTLRRKPIAPAIASTLKSRLVFVNSKSAMPE